MIAAVVPARRAARVAPIEALREAQDRPGRSLRFRLIAGAIVLALGVIPLLYGLFGSPANALQLVGLGVAFTFIGVAMLTPLIARPVAAALGAPIKRTGVPGKLGEENAKRNPRRTAATASALMIGLGLVVFVAVFGASAKASTTAILDRTLRADFILTSPTFAGFSTSAAEDMRAVPEVETVSQVRQAEVHINDGTTFITGLDPATFDAVSEAGVLEGSIADLRPGTIAVSRGARDGQRVGVGGHDHGRVAGHRRGRTRGRRDLRGERADRRLRHVARDLRRERGPATRPVRARSRPRTAPISRRCERTSRRPSRPIRTSRSRTRRSSGRCTPRS